MRHHALSRIAGTFMAGSMLLLGACGSDQSTTSPLMPAGPSFVVVGDAVDNVPTNEVLTVCKVWVGIAASDIDVTLSGDRTGTFTVPSATGTGALTCRAVAIQGSVADATITVTEDDPGANFSTTWAVNNLDNSLDANGSGLAATTTIGGTGTKGAVITFTNTFTPPPTGDEGCTPGYWKQPHHFDSWVGYAPGDDFDTVFGVDFFNPDITLQAALNLGGGGVNALARHAVAALLNAAQGFYPLSEAQVIAAVQAAYADASLIESTKNDFASDNELGCPLN